MIIQTISFKRFGQPRVPDRADPPPLRDEGVVGDEDHRPLLDHRGDLRRLGFVLYYPLRQTRCPAGRPWSASSSSGSRARAAAARTRRAARVALVMADRTRGGKRSPPPVVEGVHDDEDSRLLDDVDLLVKSPGFPAGARSSPRRARADPRLGRGRARLPAARRSCSSASPAERKTTTTELLAAMLTRRRAEPSPATSGRR